MAEKPTKRERREAARRARMEAQRRAARRKKMRQLWGALIGVAVIGGIVAAVIISGGSRRAAAAELNELAPAAGCEVPQSHPNEGRQHIDDINQAVDYQTEPPNSGDHFGSWADTGIHQTPIPTTQQVHNLEHGHVGIQYTDALPVEVVTALEEAVRGDDEWAFLAPRPEMDVPLAFTAWQWTSRCDNPGSAEDVKAYAERFVEVRKRGAPEDIAGDPR